MAKRLQIFRAGRHTDMRGASIEFTDADVAACAAAYDPAKFEAPLVVGHPEANAPAYGWVKSLAYADGEPLEAEPHQVDAAFADLVNAGKFKRISASFYMPDSPSNPVPGVWYLRHVGFLGAAAPAVKGLKPASFAADETGVVEFSDAYALSLVASLFRSMRDAFIARFGLEDADKTIPSWQIESLESAARSEVNESMPAPAYAAPARPATNEGEDPMSHQRIAELEAALAKEKQRGDAAEAAGREARFAAIAAADEKRIDALIAGGRLLPAHRAGVIGFLAAMAVVEAQTVAFGETDTSKQSSLHDWALAFMEAQPPKVDLTERARASGAPPASADFVAPEGAPVDPERAELHAKVVAYQAAHPNTDYLTALAAVQKGA